MWLVLVPNGTCLIGVPLTNNGFVSYMFQVTQEVREATLAAAADIPGQEIDMPPPPGGCYVKLLHTIEDAAYSGKSISGVYGITFLLLKVFTSN